jgi:hypothetical protein
MALQTQYPNPFDTAALLTAYARVSELNINFQSHSGVVVLSVWASPAAARSDLPPVAQVALAITPEGDTASLSYAQLYDLAAVQAEDTAGTKAYDIVRRTLYQEVKKKIGAFNNAQNV